MSTTFPLTYMGDGVFRTTPYHLARLDYGQGEIINVEEIHERSAKSHRHYFAVINDAWQNLPENLTDAFPSPETLRKRALIKCGYATLTELLCANNTEAQKAVAAFSAADPYCFCEISDNAARIWRAESQSVKAMGGKKFAESKERVLHWISNLVGADITQSEAA